ncbi:SGNH/GDSL hydrolase family protein [Mastigocladopsis repens]|uniref:SGNH/GDSL hydrolase family protein n=1 Tax=Mastigocladopsis repens TaxID=221287 RepID=UPI0002E99DDF|nr:SGNH/GDSL hydrolase family protein [Mastigocladopsis repens]
MRNKNIKKAILITGSLLPFLLPLQATAATFNKMYVFGDSLSDTGNVFNVTQVANQLNPTISIDPPSPPYFNGRYSNGLIWVDYLADALGVNLTPSTNLAVGSPITITPSGEFGVNSLFNGATTTQSVNFAFGGATSGLGNASDPSLPGVLTEIEAFTSDLARVNQSADSEALYIVWAAGSNDISAGNLSSTVFAENVSQGVTSLFNAGARNIMVLNTPDLGNTPSARSLGSNVSTLLTQLSLANNSSLAITFNNLNQTLPGINLIPIDVNSLFQEAIANPTKFGFSNVTEACLDSVTLIACTNPNEYLFWDSIHPTTAAHAIVGELAFEKLKSKPAAVPEPTSSASLGMLMLVWLLRTVTGASKSFWRRCHPVRHS